MINIYHLEFVICVNLVVNPVSDKNVKNRVYFFSSNRITQTKFNDGGNIALDRGSTLNL